MTSKHAVAGLGLYVMSAALGIATHVYAAEFSYPMAFLGSLQGSACIPSLASSDAAQAAAVDPGVLPLIALAPLNDAAGEQRFDLSFTDCASQAAASAWFYSRASSAVLQGQLLRAAGNGATWRYQLLPDDADRQLNIGVSPIAASDGAATLMRVSDADTLRYRVRYAHTVTAGMRDAAHPATGDITHVMYYH